MFNKTTAKRFIKRAIASESLAPHLDNAILLTFDDGPHPEVTPAVLRLLKKYNARALFFIVGSRIERAPHLLNRILEEGHAIGNHSYSHPLGRPPWVVPYLKDLRLCQSRIEELTGMKPKFFRPPQGRVSFASICTSKMLGLKTLLWSVDADDWKLSDSNEDAALQTASRLIQQLCEKPKRNDIVLLHDDHPHVVTVLEQLLPRLSDRKCDLYNALDSVLGTSN